MSNISSSTTSSTAAGCASARRIFVMLSMANALAIAPSVASAACPTGDPSVIYCEEFSNPNPLATYTILNPVGGNQPFTISIINQALAYTNTSPGLAFAWVLSGYPLEFRNTLYEADLRFDTTNPGLRSAMAITWANPDLSSRLQVAFQLDERRFNFYAQSASQAVERKLPWPSLEPNRTYRVAFKIDEVPGATQSRPVVLAFKGYIDGTEVFAETEDTLGVDLSALPTRLSPGFHGGSYSWTPVNQLFDNALVRKAVRIACTGFEPPLSNGPVTVNKNRALPFKMQLADAQGLPVTSLGSVPPVIQVVYAPLVGDSVDVSALAVPVGQGTDGNQFVFADGKWQYNLQTKAYLAPGTYTVTVAPGNGYSVEPTCTGSFVVK